MKRLYIGAGLLAVMLALGIFLTTAFRVIHEPLQDALLRAQAAAVEGDWQEATELTGQARQRWEKYRHFVAAVADHEPLEEMDGLFARLEALGRLRVAEEFAADCAELARLCHAMTQSQQITWWSFL